MRAELEHLPFVEGPGGAVRHGEQILALLDQYQPLVCVELGTWFGGSAIPVARRIREWGGRLTCVDVWLGEPVVYDGLFIPNTIARCSQNLEVAGVRDNVTLMQCPTHDAGRQWLHGLIDFLFIDADHSYDACLSDLELWWPHIRVGGLVVGDDYGDPRYGVTEAWNDFAEKHGQLFEHQVTPGMTTQLVWGIKR